MFRGVAMVTLTYMYDVCVWLYVYVMGYMYIHVIDVCMQICMC